MAQPAVFQGNVVDENGTVVPNAQITVNEADGGALATIYSDVDLSNQTSNPFNADGNGSFEFYVEGQILNVTADDGAFTRTWSNVHVNVESLKTANVLWEGANAYTSPQNFQDTILFPNSVVGGKFNEMVSNPYGGYVWQTNGTRHLNLFDLSNSNTVGTESDRGASRLGIEAMMTRKFNSDLGTAASKDLTNPSDEIWDTGNLNPNLFEGTTDDQILMTGVAQSGSIATFYANTDLISQATTVTYSGLFKVYNHNTGAFSGSGFSSLSLSGARTNKMTILKILSGLSGINMGDNLELRCDSGSASILIE